MIQPVQTNRQSRGVAAKRDQTSPRLLKAEHQLPEVSVVGAENSLLSLGSRQHLGVFERRRVIGSPSETATLSHITWGA